MFVSVTSCRAGFKEFLSSKMMLSITGGIFLIYFTEFNSTASGMGGDLCPVRPTMCSINIYTDIHMYMPLYRAAMYSEGTIETFWKRTIFHLYIAIPSFKGQS